MALSEQTYLVFSLLTRHARRFVELLESIQRNLGGEGSVLHVSVTSLVTHLAFPGDIVENVIDRLVGVVARDTVLLVSYMGVWSHLGVSQELAVRLERVVRAVEVKEVHLRHLL